MTLAAIAKEIECRNAERTAEVRVAAGLPLTGFGREMEKFRKYLRRDGRPVSFRYEGRDYNVLKLRSCKFTTFQLLIFSFHTYKKF